MNGSDYRDWMLRAFWATQGRLLSDISRKFSYVSEEKVRMAFMEGLVLAEPSEAHRVKEEEDVPWSTALCWHDPLHGGATGPGRRIQHDVWIDPERESEPALACELKWLKQRKPLEIEKDVWKLALSRGTTSEQGALRTYLLIGGEKGVFAPTLGSVRVKHIDLKWSRRGSRSNGSLPPPRKFSMKRFLDSGGDQSFSKLCSWGSSPSHMRHPPNCRDQLRLTCVESWEKVVGARGWRLALWEIDAFSCKGTMDWKGNKAFIEFKCPAPVAAK
jgi:hypothetical protein